MGSLYQISFPNGKAYIGMTEGTPERRFLDHRYHARMGHKGVVYSAIRKHGVENANFQVLAVAEGRDYLSTLERRAIAILNTRVPFGYNMTDGGDGAPVGHKYRVGLKHSEEAKRRMSELRRENPYKHTDEAKKKIGAASKGNRYAVGAIRSAESQAKVVIGNRSKFKGAKSGHVGVSWHTYTKKWRAHLTLNRKFIDLGVWKTIEEAVAARAAGEEKYFRGR